MARARWGRSALTAAVAVVLGAGIGAGAPAGGQPGPTMTVDPTRTGPDQQVEVAVSGCSVLLPEGPTVSLGYRFDDVLSFVPMTESSPGTWTGTFSSGDADATVRASCDGVELEATVDTDAPRLLAMPWAPPGSPPDPPEWYLGTDCPDGTTARAFFQVAGRPAPILVTAAIDERGDWRAEVPDVPDGLRVFVSASCGDVDYPSTDYVSGGTGSVTTTSTTAPPTVDHLPLGQAPAPAVPQRATPAFTG